jgi:hypothetical protein
MKTSNYSLRLLATFCCIILFTCATNAQGRGRNDGYRRSNNHYYNYGPRVSVGIGYNPYHNFQPFYGPRTYYRPPYRTPYPYIHYGPAFGFRINVLPFGYSRFYIGNDPFYYYDGIYYRPYKTGGYTVTQPPMGATVKHLPAGAKTTIIDGQKYYELGGTFYQKKITDDNKVRYEVVGTDGVLNTTNANTMDDEPVQAPAQTPVSEQPAIVAAPKIGSMVNQLPEGCNLIVINDEKFHVSPTGVYYQEVVDGNNVISYKVAGTSSQNPQ